MYDGSQEATMLHFLKFVQQKHYSPSELHVNEGYPCSSNLKCILMADFGVAVG